MISTPLLLRAACLAGVWALLVSCYHKKAARTIGFSQEGAEGVWRTTETDSVKSEAQKRGVDLRFNDAEADQEKQFKAMRSFVAQHVDAIILAPKVKTGWEPILREAKAANIPVILVDRGVDAPEELYTTLIESDFVEEGRRAADWLVAHTQGKPVKIVQLEGQAGSAPAIDRKKGFEQVIEKHPNMQIVASQDANFELPKGKEVMANFIKLQGGIQNITAVYAHNDDMALGAIQAITDAGGKPGDDVLVLSIDGTRPALQALLEKKMNCVVECNPLLGPDAFDAIDAVLGGKTIEKKKVEKDQLFDQSNVTPELVKERKY